MGWKDQEWTSLWRRMVVKEQDDLNTHPPVDPLYELLNVDYGKVEM